MPSLGHVLWDNIALADHRAGRTALVDNSTGRWWVVRTDAVLSALSSEASAKSYAAQLSQHTTLPLYRSPTNPRTYVIYKLTDKCNYSCTYCYDRDFARKKNGSKRNLAIRTFLEKKAHEEPGSKIGILFHGGEPLLEFNEIHDLLRYCAQKSEIEISFSLQTNASLLDQEKFRILDKFRVGMCFSIDGVDAEANRLRVNKYDENCYSLVRNKIATISGLTPENAGLLFTIGAHNIGSVCDAIIQAQADGFRSVSFSFMHSLNKSCVPATPKEILELYKALITATTNGRLHSLAVWSLIDWIKKIITGTSDSVCHSSPCGAGRSLLTISPSGEFAPCDSLFSDEFYFDSYQSYLQGRLTSEPFRALLDRSVDVIDGCNTCDVRSLCNGTCPGNANLSAGSVSTIDRDECKIQYELIKELIWALSDPVIGETLLSYVRSHSDQREQFLAAKAVQ